MLFKPNYLEKFDAFSKKECERFLKHTNAPILNMMSGKIKVASDGNGFSTRRGTPNQSFQAHGGGSGGEVIREEEVVTEVLPTNSTNNIDRTWLSNNYTLFGPGGQPYSQHYRTI